MCSSTDGHDGNDILGIKVLGAKVLGHNVLDNRIINNSQASTVKISRGEADISLSRFVDRRILQEICDNFTELYGIGIRVFTAAGEQLLAEARGPTKNHCGYLFAISSTKLGCVDIVEQVRRRPFHNHESFSMLCFSGLQYRVHPVVQDEQNIGRMVFGPFRPLSLEHPPKELLIHSSKGLNLPVLDNYLQPIPQINPATVKRICSRFDHMLQLLISSYYQVWQTHTEHSQSISAAQRDLKETNFQLQQANQRLLELDRLKSSFVATVSHELRTPLTSIIGYAEMLLEELSGPLNDGQRGNLQVIKGKGDELLAMIGKILDLSRMESDNSYLDRSLVDPATLLEDVLSNLRPQSIRDNISFNTHIDTHVVPIIIDIDKVRRVLINLIANAMKFSEGDNLQVNIRMTIKKDSHPISTRRQSDLPITTQWLHIEVEDFGIGIPEEYHDRVFDSFFQVDHGATRKYGGSGLGLAIVRSFMSAHGGTAHIASKETQGSLFVLRLPYPKTALSASIAKGIVYL